MYQALLRTHTASNIELGSGLGVWPGGVASSTHYLYVCVSDWLNTSSVAIWKVVTQTV